jgi:hypothetical protein
MIQDNLLMIASQTALSTVGTGRARVGNTLDTQVARNLGSSGKQMFLRIAVRTTVTSAGAATVAFALVSDSVTPVAADGTATEHLRTPAIPVAQLVAGYVRGFALPPEMDVPYERYLGVLQDVATAALTAGAVDISLTTDVPDWKPLPSA